MAGIGLDEREKAGRCLELDRLHLGALMRHLPESASPEVVARLERIRAGYEELLAAKPPAIPLYDHANLRRKSADCLESIARACDCMGTSERALASNEQAALAHEALGRSAEAVRCRECASLLRVSQAAEVDPELERLNARAWRLARARRDSRRRSRRPPQRRSSLNAMSVPAP